MFVPTLAIFLQIRNSYFEIIYLYLIQQLKEIRFISSAKQDIAYKKKPPRIIKFTGNVSDVCKYC